MKICFDKDESECATAFMFDNEDSNDSSSCDDMISWLSENNIQFNKFRLTKNSPYCLVVNRISSINDEQTRNISTYLNNCQKDENTDGLENVNNDSVNVLNDSNTKEVDTQEVDLKKKKRKPKE